MGNSVDVLMDRLKDAFLVHFDWTKVNNISQEKGETLENFVEHLRVTMIEHSSMSPGVGWDNIFRCYIAVGLVK